MFTLLLGMIPTSYAAVELTKTGMVITNDDTGNFIDETGAGSYDNINGTYGDLIIIEGPADSVSSGYEVNLYWDKIATWNGEKGFLNTTEVDDDGGYEIWFEVPEGDVGTHQLWITATDQSTTLRIEFYLRPSADGSASSGLAGDKVYVDLFGFDDNKDVAILFALDFDETTWNVDSEDNELLDTGDASETDFDGTLANTLVVNGTLSIQVADVEIAADDGAGNIVDTNGVDAYTVDDGSINYVTGEWELEFGAAPAAVDIDADYDFIDELEDDTYVLVSSGETNTLGSFLNKKVTIPSNADEGDYYLIGYDGDGNTAYADFEIGAVIYLSDDEGVVGQVVEVEGMGFANDAAYAIILVGDVDYECLVVDSDDAPVTDGEGKFKVDIIIPSVDDEDDYEIRVDCGADHPLADFEVTELSSIDVDPQFGPQGSKVTVTGTNFPQQSGVDVYIELYDDAGWTYVADIDDTETKSDGTFSIECIVPTENDDPYQVFAYADFTADDGNYSVWAVEDFRIGTILVLLSDDEADVGDDIVLTGNGFSEGGEWNATFGDIVIFDEVETDNSGRLKDSGEGGDTPVFYVPQVDPGDYVITVWDVDEEIVVQVDFTVVEGLELEFSTYEAPNEYNVSISGWNLPEEDALEIEWVMYNETEEWDMNVSIGIGLAKIDAAIGARDLDAGDYEGWFRVIDDETLSMGTYTINGTITTDNDQEYFVQFEFVIGDQHEYIAPRKSTFRIDDAVSFIIQHSFGGDAKKDYDQSTVTVYDPDGEVYWNMDPAVAGDWVEKALWWELPASEQTVAGNLMVLLDDAPLGEWSYVWEDEDGDEIDDGTFMVEAATADVIGQQVTDLSNEITDLADQLGDVTAEFDDVKSDIADVAAIAEQAVTAAQQAAEAVQTVAQTANTASQAASDAAEAANAARDAANGLTTLVYGAIGAALVAALAAIVSLMQISRRIAG